MKLDTGEFDIGDKVIIRPDLTIGVSYDNVTFLSEMKQPGIFKIKDITSKNVYILEDNGYCYSREMLLPCPIFNPGDVVHIKASLDPKYKFSVNQDMLKYRNTLVTINSAHISNYTPDRIGLDGVLYTIKEDNVKWSWSSEMFDLPLIIHPLIIQNNENQLQRKKTCIRRADIPEGNRVCCGKRKAAVVFGPLSNQARVGF